MEYDKYEDKLRAQNKSLCIDYIFEVLFGYSYAELRLAEGADENNTDKNLICAGRAFKLLNGWIIIKFDSTEDNMYQLDDFFSWIDEEEIFEKIKSEVSEYEVPERAVEFMAYVRDANKNLEPVDEPRATDGKLESKNCFKPDGRDNWRITFMGKELGLVKNSDGMQYISILLHSSGRIRSEELYGFNKVDKSDREKLHGEEFLEDVGGEKRLSGMAYQHPGQRTIDDEGMKNLKAKIKLLENELEEIKESDYFGNEELETNKENREHELSELKEYLRKNTRPDRDTGRTVPTNFSSEAKKASEKIHHALKTAYKNIKKESPELEEHLRKAIKCRENQFSYKLHKSNLINWEVVLK